MSHLDTAYKLGAAAAMEDFQAMAQKEAQGVAGTPPPQKTMPPPKAAPPPPAFKPGQSTPPPAAPGVVNPGRDAGHANRPY